MGVELLPPFVREHYEVHEWKHACAILHQDFPREWDDLVALLTQFRLLRSQIVEPGGRKSKVAKAIDAFLYKREWRERKFATKIVVDATEIESPTHKVDCFKNGVNEQGHAEAPGESGRA
jgi:hypothetical protein